MTNVILIIGFLGIILALIMLHLGIQVMIAQLDIIKYAYELKNIDSKLSSLNYMEACLEKIAVDNSKEISEKLDKLIDSMKE